MKRFSEFEKSIKIYLFEKSEKLIGTQKKNIKSKNVTWIKNLNEIKNGPILFFGNEFLDSIPIKQFIFKKKQLYEKYIELDKGKFKQILFLKRPQ